MPRCCSSGGQCCTAANDADLDDGHYMTNATPTIYDVLDEIRAHPGIYFANTLPQVESCIIGYELALVFHDISHDVEIPPFRQFAEWLSRKFGDVKIPIIGWCSTILARSADDAGAVDAFFDLLDEFRTRMPTKVAKAIITPVHAPTGNYEHGYKKHAADFVDLTWVMPIGMNIVTYATDKGCYLVCLYSDGYFTETYFSHIIEAEEKAERDFRIAKADWSFMLT